MHQSFRLSSKTFRSCVVWLCFWQVRRPILMDGSVDIFHSSSDTHSATLFPFLCRGLKIVSHSSILNTLQKVSNLEYQEYYEYMEWYPLIWWHSLLWEIQFSNNLIYSPRYHKLFSFFQAVTGIETLRSNIIVS